MATHGAPAQGAGRVAQPPVFQASPSQASSGGHHHHHRPHAGQPVPGEIASAFDTACALIGKAHAWYTTPCTLPPHRREMPIRLAIFISLIFVFILALNWIGAWWRARRASRNKKLQ